MSQNLDVLAKQMHFTRADFTALRAYLNRLPLNQIGSLYYSEDDLEDLGCTTESSLRLRLETLRDQLILQASDENPHIAELLRNARKTSFWSSKLVDYLVRAGESIRSLPNRRDPLSQWLKPRLVNVLREDNVRTIGELISLIETRGASWWKPVRRIGEGKARRLEYWLEQNEQSVGAIVREEQIPVSVGELVLISPTQQVLVPLERIAVPIHLDGQNGINRSRSFCQISAKTDLQAVDAYLHKFRGQEKTRRAYQKELERFVLWCISERGVALSSVLHGDCEAYKDFLDHLPSHWIAEKTRRTSSSWRPFAGQLSASSKRYAIQAIRFFFNWLVDVRYLGANPWATVTDPAVAKPLNPIQIEKALPAELWDKLCSERGILDLLCSLTDEELRIHLKVRGRMSHVSLGAQFRLVRAALLLIGDTGIRREEATIAVRSNLKPIPGNEQIWELSILGKRNKWRTVFPSIRSISAIKAHWQDRNLDFTFGLSDIPLLSPVILPCTETALTKHTHDDGSSKERGFSPDGLYRMIKTAFKRIASWDEFDLTYAERECLLNASPHALRHTFGTNAIAADVPLDVVQRILGHASLQTTTIYVQAEKKRSIDELTRFFK